MRVLPFCTTDGSGAGVRGPGRGGGAGGEGGEALAIHVGHRRPVVPQEGLQQVDAGRLRPRGGGHIRPMGGASRED